MASTTIDSLATPTAAPTATRTDASPWKRRIGWILSGLAILFLTFDAIAKIVLVEAVAKGSVELGYPVSTMVPIGIVLLTCVLIYAVPRTAVIGAVLLTGYLGGAIATHVRVDNPLFSHILFPIYVAIFIWGGLYLRDARVRALLVSR
jgi:DoxX-like protein